MDTVRNTISGIVRGLETMPDFSFLDSVFDKYLKAIQEVVLGKIEKISPWERNEYVKVPVYEKEGRVSSQVTKSDLDEVVLRFTVTGETVSVRPYFYSPWVQYRGVRIPDLTGTASEIATQLPAFKANLLTVLGPLIQEEQVRRDAKQQFGKATTLIQKAIENALYSKWNVKVDVTPKETLIVEGKPFQKVNYVIKGVLPRIKEQATREFSDPAIKAVKEILGKVIPKLKIGNVKMKLSSTPSSWSDYNIDGDVILYMDGTKPPRMARGDLIRMAYAHPDKRAALLPLIKRAAPEVPVTLKMDLKLRNGDVIPKGTKGVVLFGLHGGHNEDPEGASVRFEGRKALLLKVPNFYKYFGHPFTAPPSDAELDEMSRTGVATTPLGETVAPTGFDKYQAASWLLIFGYV